jgi:hypothetical protein
MVNGDPDLRLSILKRVDGAEAIWESAIAFFEQNESLLKAIRNDIGGHFGHAAALNAVDNLRPDAYSAIELVDGREFRLHFAGEIAATALLPHLENDDIEEFETLLRDCVVPAYKHATRCVQMLVMEYLWPRWGQ